MKPEAENDIMNPENVLTVVETLLSLSKTIYRMVGNVKANSERCQELNKRVQELEKLVLKIQQRGQGQISPSLGDTLRGLCGVLQSTKKWIEKYAQNKRLKKFFRGGSHEEKFRKLNQQLSESCQSLSLALLVDHGEKIDVIYDTLTQRGAVRQRAAIPTFSAPTSQALVPAMPLPGPSSFPLDINYAPLGQTSVFNPFIPQPLPLTNIGFSSAIYNPSLASQYLNFPNVAGMTQIPQFSSVAFSNNGTVAFASKTTYYGYQ